jgi:uncharacterized protein (DUF1778 family)
MSARPPADRLSRPCRDFTIRVRVTARERALLQAIASAQGCNLSEAVRGAIKALATPPTVVLRREVIE